MTPYFSILTTAYNVGKYIGECIESVEKQVFGDWEHIIVNDCSSDNTVSIVEKHLNKQRRLYHLNKKQCCGYALKYAFEKARGKYAVILDGDDMLLPHSLARMHRHIEENPGYSLYYSKYYNYDDKSKRCAEVDCLPLPSIYSYLDFFILRTEYGISNLGYPLKKVKVSHLKVVDISLYRKTEGLSPTLVRGVDVNLILLMEEVGKFSFCNDFLYKYRRREGSLTRNGMSKKEKKELNYSIIENALRRRYVDEDIHG